MSKFKPNRRVTPGFWIVPERPGATLSFTVVLRIGRMWFYSKHWSAPFAAHQIPKIVPHFKNAVGYRTLREAIDASKGVIKS